VKGPGPYGRIMTLANITASRDCEKYLKWTHNGKMHFTLTSYYSSTRHVADKSSVLSVKA